MGLIWFALLVIIAIAVAVDIYFWVGKNPDEKRQLYPWAWALLGGLLIGFVVFVLPLPLPYAALFGLIVALGTFAHIRQVRFCPKCARVIRQGPFSHVDYCPRCGHSLDDAAEG